MAKIYPLSEGVFTVGRDKAFVPFDQEKDELTDRPTGSLLVEVQPFLIALDKDLVLLDTGLGFFDSSGILQIHQNIRKVGYEPEQVTKVLLSHLHKDHSGGASFETPQGIRKTSFLNATYHIYRSEADFALETGAPSYLLEEIEPLLASGQASWLDGPKGNITPQISFRHSGGHCPEHIVFLIDDGKDKVFFGGDEAPQLRQLKMKYIARYDFDGRKAMELRQSYAEEGRKEGWKFLFYHDISTPIATLP